MSNIENIVEIAESLETLEAPKVKKSRGRPKALKVETDLPIEEVAEVKEPTPPKVKRAQSELQKQNFAKALEARKRNIELRKAAKLAAEEAKEVEQEVKKQKLEKVIIKKAVCLKKKELLSQACLEDLSDCEVPDEVIQKVIKTQRSKAKAKVVVPVVPLESPKPKYNFV
jgi:hypothetical protein